MKITILGSGSAYGVPMMFNTWGNADSTNPQSNRTRASILIEDERKSILVDCGPDFREQINKNKVKNIDAVLMTHGHYDHIAGIPELPRATKLLGHSIEVYAAEKTMAELKNSFGYLFTGQAEAEPDSKKIEWKVLPDFGQFSVCGLDFTTSLLPHHSIFSSSFRYKDFAYVTDWQELTPEAKSMLQNLKLLIVECNNGFEKAKNGHSDIDNIKKIVAEVAPQRIILTHISARVDDKKLSSEFELAYDGQIIEI